MLHGHGVAISMDGRGCWRDNVFVERLWRSIKYEEVYLYAYESVSAAKAGVGWYLEFYNGPPTHRARRPNPRRGILHPRNLKERSLNEIRVAHRPIGSGQPATAENSLTKPGNLS